MSNSTYRNTLTIPLGGINRQFDNDNPRFVHGRGGRSGTYMLLALCYDTLAGPTPRRGTDGIASPNVEDMQPRLAESFTEQDDGSWRVSLTRGVKSHYGNELTSETIRWAFEKAFALETLGAWRWGQIAGVADADHIEILDDYSLRFRLRAPNPLLPAFFFSSTPMIVDATELSRHSTPEDPWALDWLADNVAGFGGFLLEEMNDDLMRFHSRPEYWAGEPPVGEINVTRITSRSEAPGMLDSHEPVLLLGLSCDELRLLQGHEDIQLVGSWAGHTSLQLAYHRPPFDDVRVRQALSFATPYERVIEDGFLGYARRWKTPLKGFSPWATDRFWSYEPDMKRARELLAAAGYQDGFSTSLYTDQRADLLRIAGILVDAYAQIGVEVTVQDLGKTPAGWIPPMFLRTECAHNLTEPMYDLAHDYAATDPIVPAPGGRVGAPNWYPRYIGAREIEDAYRAALLAESSMLRQERCVELQRQIVEFAPCVFLAENVQFNAANSACHPWVGDFGNNLVQRTLWQVTNSNYLTPAQQPRL